MNKKITKKTILFVVNADWFFLSHRLPIAKKAIEEGRMEKMKSGGSVMARGGRMGRSKPTKMY